MGQFCLLAEMHHYMPSEKCCIAELCWVYISAHIHRKGCIETMMNGLIHFTKGNQELLLNLKEGTQNMQSPNKLNCSSKCNHHLEDIPPRLPYCCISVYSCHGCLKSKVILQVSRTHKDDMPNQDLYEHTVVFISQRSNQILSFLLYILEICHAITKIYKKTY